MAEAEGADISARVSSADEPLERYLDRLIDRHSRLARRLYRLGLGIRIVIVAASFFAVLPDSALFKFGNLAESYGIVTTAAGVLAAFLFVIVHNLRIGESLKMHHESIQYLQDKKLYILTRDSLSQQIAEIELRKELAAREAKLQKGVFEGLDRLFESWGGGR